MKPKPTIPEEEKSNREKLSNIGYEIIDFLIDKTDSRYAFDAYDDYEDLAETIEAMIVEKLYTTVCVYTCVEGVSELF